MQGWGLAELLGVVQGWGLAELLGVAELLEGCGPEIGFGLVGRDWILY